MERDEAAALFERVRLGSDRALNAVFERYGGRLLALIRLRMGPKLPPWKPRAYGFGEASGKYLDITQGQNSVGVPNGFIQRLIEGNLQAVRLIFRVTNLGLVRSRPARTLPPLPRSRPRGAAHLRSAQDGRAARGTQRDLRAKAQGPPDSPPSALTKWCLRKHVES